MLLTKHTNPPSPLLTFSAVITSKHCGHFRPKGDISLAWKQSQKDKRYCTYYLEEVTRCPDPIQCGHSLESPGKGILGPAIFASSGNVGPEEGDELEESGPLSSCACGPCLALLLHAFACTQASTCRALLMVVRDFLLLLLHTFLYMSFGFIFF